MELLEIFLIPFVLIFGVVSSYTDYKEMKIRNKLIFFALSYSIIIFCGVLFYSYITHIDINRIYIFDYFSNIFFSILAAIIIWLGGLWPAGDAKLFIAYSAIVPLSIYSFGYNLYFPSYTLLINTFLPIFIYYFFKIFIKTSFKAKSEALKNLFNLKFILSSFFFIFSFLWVINFGLRYINQYTKIFNNLFLIVLLLFIIMYFFNNFLKVNLIYVSISISIFVLLFDYKTIFTLNYILDFFSIFIFFIFFIFFIISLSHGFFSKSIYIEDLKVGMIPSENYFKEGDKYTKKKIISISFLSSLIENSNMNRLFHSVSDGLTNKEITIIQTLHSSGVVKDHSISVAIIIPFAPFMFLGVLLTFLFKGNILYFIVFLLEKFI